MGGVNILQYPHMEKVSCTCCLLVLIGIPGSGKTTFSRHLSDYITSLTHLQWRPLVISFDDFYPIDLRYHNSRDVALVKVGMYDKWSVVLISLL